jgi:6-pyruvoyltetrahydropterin/6-carboxytetrahydropterin synthase
VIACISKTFKFEAAHSLPNHDGKCKNPHGHSYRVVVYVRGPVCREPDHPKEGMVLDFADIKAVWKSHLEPNLDHKDLNVTMNGMVTTAENIAGRILATFRANLVPVDKVEVWETETSCASVTFSDAWTDGGVLNQRVDNAIVQAAAEVQYGAKRVPIGGPVS